MRAATVTIGFIFEKLHFVRFQWLLQQPNSCVFVGSVGQDKYHQLLHDAGSQAGLLLSYQVKNEGEERIQTGTCAVLITGNHRFVIELRRQRSLFSFSFYIQIIGR